MPEICVSTEEVRHDISNLVNRVAYRGERILLTSEGRPIAALVSVEDYERLQQDRVRENLATWTAWLEENRKLAADILARRDGEPLDVDALWEAARSDLDSRDDHVSES